MRALEWEVIARCGSLWGFGGREQRAWSFRKPYRL